jgi:hypothetical protein
MIYHGGLNSYPSMHPTPKMLGRQGKGLNVSFKNNQIPIIMKRSIKSTLWGGI